MITSGAAFAAGRVAAPCMDGRQGTGTAGRCPGPSSAGNILWASVVRAGRNATSCGVCLEGKVVATPVPTAGAAVIAAAATKAAVVAETTAPGVAGVAVAAAGVAAAAEVAGVAAAAVAAGVTAAATLPGLTASNAVERALLQTPTRATRPLPK